MRNKGLARQNLRPTKKHLVATSLTVVMTLVAVGCASVREERSRGTATSTPLPLSAVNGQELPDGARIPDLPPIEPVSPERQELLLAERGAAQQAADRLVNMAGRDGFAGLKGTFKLVQAAGIDVGADSKRKTADNPPRLIQAAQKPWIQGFTMRSGQAVGLARAIQLDQTYSLNEFLNFVHRTTGISPKDKLPLRPLAQGLLQELTAPERNPIFAAIVLGHEGGPTDIRPALQAIANGQSLSAPPHIRISATQYVFLLLRLRTEFLEAMKHLATTAQGSIPGETKGLAPGPPNAMSVPQVCKLDDPWIDTTASLLSDTLGAKVVERLEAADYFKALDAEHQTSGSLSHLVAVGNLVSTLLNLAFVAAYTQITIRPKPNPIVRTKSTTKAGEQGSLMLHAEVSGAPQNRYSDCLKALAFAGFTLPSVRNAPIADASVHWQIVEGKQYLKTTGFEPTDRSIGSTDDRGNAYLGVEGRRQSKELPRDVVRVERIVGVRGTINPDAAEAWYQTTWAAFADATSMFMALTGGKLRRPKPSPIAIIDEAIGPATRALNYFGWLHVVAPISVRDWEDAAGHMSGTLQYQYQGSGSSGVYEETATVAYSLRLDPVSGVWIDDGNTHVSQHVTFTTIYACGTTELDASVSGPPKPQRQHLAVQDGRRLWLSVPRLTMRGTEVGHNPCIDEEIRIPWMGTLAARGCHAEGTHPGGGWQGTPGGSGPISEWNLTDYCRFESDQFQAELTVSGSLTLH